MRLPAGETKCPHCGSDTLVDRLGHGWFFCVVCSKTFQENDARPSLLPVAGKPHA